MTATLARDLAAARLDWLLPQWSGPARVAALFTTRSGGSSAGAAATMDVGPAHPTAGELEGAIGANRRRLAAFLPAAPIWLSQVHGCAVVNVDARNAAALRALPPRADAAVVSAPRIAVAVRTADCLPVLFADRAGSVLGVAHAGWRGLAAGVLEATLAAMNVPAHDIVGWIGPAIGPHAFEVGADVHGMHCSHDAGAAAHFSPLREGKWLADLPALARRRLLAAGVTDVAGGHWCTHADAARFFSYRRDQTSGRMALVAWLADS